MCIRDSSHKQPNRSTTPAMSSSPLTTVSVEPGVLARPGLLELFEQVTDPRTRRGVRHRFASLLAVALAAVLGGARSSTATGEWVAEADAGVLARLGVAGSRRPCKAIDPGQHP